MKEETVEDTLLLILSKKKGENILDFQANASGRLLISTTHKKNTENYEEISENASKSN